MDYPTVVQAWKQTDSSKRRLAAFTVVDSDDEFESFKQRWPEHIFTTRSLNYKEKKARSIRAAAHGFQGLFNLLHPYLFYNIVENQPFFGR